MSASIARSLAWLARSLATGTRVCLGRALIASRGPLGPDERPPMLLNEHAQGPWPVFCPVFYGAQLIGPVGEHWVSRDCQALFHKRQRVRGHRLGEAAVRFDDQIKTAVVDAAVAALGWFRTNAKTHGLCPIFAQSIKHTALPAHHPLVIEVNILLVRVHVLQ